MVEDEHLIEDQYVCTQITSRRHNINLLCCQAVMLFIGISDIFDIFATKLFLYISENFAFYMSDMLYVSCMCVHACAHAHTSTHMHTHLFNFFHIIQKYLIGGLEFLVEVPTYLSFLPPCVLHVCVCICSCTYLHTHVYTFFHIFLFLFF